jgi:hypothetical protein
MRENRVPVHRVAVRELAREDTEARELHSMDGGNRMDGRAVHEDIVGA